MDRQLRNCRQTAAVGGLLLASAMAAATAQSTSYIEPLVTTQVVGAAAQDLYRYRVSYADLNLATAAGQQTLNQRIGMAIRKLCINQADPIDLHASASERQCRAMSKASVEGQIAAAIAHAQLASRTASR